MIKVIILVLICATGFSGVRTVGNGGGLGEMKAHFAFQDMDRHLMLCLNLGRICPLREEQAALLQKVLRSFPEEKRSGGVQFFDDPSGKRTVEVSKQVGTPLFLNSALLTTPQGLASPMETVASYVLWGLLRHQQDETAGLDLWKLAQTVFENLRENDLSQTFWLEGFSYKIHDLKILSRQNGSLVTEYLLVEDVEKTYDLIAFSGLGTQCKQGALVVKSVNDVSGTNRGDHSAQLQWSCDGKSWGQAVLFYKIRLDNQGKLLLPISISIRGLIKPSTGV